MTTSPGLAKTGSARDVFEASDRSWCVLGSMLALCDLTENHPRELEQSEGAGKGGGPRDDREGPFLDGGHVREDDRGLGREAVELARGLVVAVAEGAHAREASVVEEPAGTGAVLLDVVVAAEHALAPRQLAVDGLHHRVAHYGIERF